MPMQMEVVHYSVMPSPVGRLRIAVSARGLMSLEFADKPELPPPPKRQSWQESEPHTRDVVQQLSEYFAGERQEFSLSLDLRGTDFQKACWTELLDIPYGKTTSYLRIARRVGSPAAMRAVGQANHHNPVAIVVPCHRVVTHDGKLGGYGGGLHIKTFLLQLEGAWQVPQSGNLF